MISAYTLKKNRITREYKKRMKELTYYERLDKKFKRLQKKQVPKVTMRFPHTWKPNEIIKDNESRIEIIAKLHGYIIADERLTSTYSQYWFVLEKPKS